MKHYLRSKLSPTNQERLKIISEGYKAFRRTFGRTTKRPVELQAVRSALEELGVAPGDHLLVHSSLGKLSTRRQNGPFNPFPYAAGLIDLLLQLVGPEGSLWMPTDHGIGYDRAMRGEVFDFRKTPSDYGLIGELFRRRKEVIRSTYPFQNLTGWGSLAKELIPYHEAHPSPYAMDRSSPWFQLQERGGKALFLGTGFENNSSIHLVEYIHHEEYPTALFFHKPFAMSYRNREGREEKQELYIHPFFRKAGAATRFCRHLQQHYGLYKEVEREGALFTLFSLKQQYEAVLKEMRSGVTLYDPKFWPS